MATNTFKTSLVIQGAPVPTDFQGTPQEFFEAILARMQIYSPFGFTSFVTGAIKPSSNQGPWLKDGTKWYVWDDDAADYVPLDLSDSADTIRPYWLQEEVPTSPIPPLWFKTDASGGNVVAGYFWSGGQWRGIFGATGVTSERPPNPVNFEKFYDTEISAEIWWERGQWRTTSGVKGDVKYVTWPTREEALRRNPGWEVLGTGESENLSWRGRSLVAATRDNDGSNALDVGGSISQKNAASINAGEEKHALSEAELAAHAHTGLTFVRGSGNETALGAVDATTLSGLDSIFHENGAHTVNSTAQVKRDGEVRLNNTGTGEPHNNMPPAVQLWCLRKT